MKLIIKHECYHEAMDITRPIPYVAFLKSDTELSPERLEYAFHTFSLNNEKCYRMTRDVSFTSPNEDAVFLAGGVERLVHAVLSVDVSAIVLNTDDLDVRLNDAGDPIYIADGIIRSRHDLEQLRQQMNSVHEDVH